MIKIFFSYSHEDESYRNQLEKHLSVLMHEGSIEMWHDRRLLAGSFVDTEIDYQIDSADIILLLVSATFLSSRYCYSVEMKRALTRQGKNEVQIIPVIVHACDWRNSIIGKLLAAPKDGKPISSWPIIEEAFLDVTLKIRAVILAKESIRSGSSNQQHLKSEPNPAEINIHSSNLRLRKSFSDIDQRKFCQDSWEFIAKFFEASLTELKTTNPLIGTHFKVIDTNTFIAAIYINDFQKNECSINYGSNTITINGAWATPVSRASPKVNNSYNEQLFIEIKDQSLLLKISGSSALHRLDKNVSQKGAAELLWELLIKPFQ